MREQIVSRSHSPAKPSFYVSEMQLERKPPNVDLQSVLRSGRRERGSLPDMSMVIYSKKILRPQESLKT